MESPVSDSSSSHERKDTNGSLSRKLLTRVLLPIGVVFGAVILFVTIFGAPLPIAKSDHDLIFSVTDLKVALPDLRVDPNSSTFSKAFLLTEGLELNYEYSSATELEVVFISSFFERHHSLRRAEKAFRFNNLVSGGALSLFGGDLQQIRSNDLFKWGDQSHLALLKSDGDTLGLFFSTQIDRVLFSVMIIADIDYSADSISKLLHPRLERVRKG
ncbi:hypothetical protein JYT83_01145 [bacterium AH-315-F18]|nr:hypothetical protein [bacterium AH-315-F18]